MSGTQNGRSPRSVALVGPYSSGKSSLFDALMEAAGTPVKRPADPRNRPSTTELRIGHCQYLGDAWAIVDCPGSIEFAYEVTAALTAVDLAVVVCEPTPARALTVAPLLKQLADQGVPHMVFVNKIDTLEGSVADTLTALQGYAKCPLVLRQVPIRHGETITGYVDVVSERAYRYRKGQPSELVQIPSEMQADEQEALNKLVEVLADRDDVLLEKVLEDVKPSTAEIYADLRKDLAEGSVIGMLLGGADNAHGVRRLWKALRHDTPFNAETAERHGVTAEGPPIAQVFKTVHAGHTGKLSYARIWRGGIKDGAALGGSRLGGLYHTNGAELAKCVEAQTGELVALGRLESVATGATVSPNGAPEALPFPAAPPPVYSLAIATTDRKDDVKLSGALQKLVEEDPTLRIEHQPDTGETILHGQGEIHLNTVVERLARNYALRLTTHRPQVAFKETIRLAVHEHGRLKRQTGGHGQFADVKIDIAPRPRGAGFEFIDKIVGGAVPRNFIPAVGEAAEDAAKKGPFGYPVVDISVTLTDGQFHSVDSSDMAFKTATSLAMKEGLAKADPVVLEPIEHVTLSVPNEFTARAQRLLSGRRGQILGYAERPGWSGWDDVEALVPAAELHDLIIELRSQTLGLGTYCRRFDHLAEARVEAKRGAA
ncbi:MAG TPA: elongation factor G [Acetobacteraceae bacterium]|jgi:elongation factor G|nr:elongation factor G [Acetobacteraceae bacterium]